MAKKDDNGFIDISPFLKDLPKDACDDPDAAIPGLTSKTFTITGTWCIPLPKCGICGEEFQDGPEGIAILTHEATGFSVKACPQCAIAFIPDSD